MRCRCRSAEYPDFVAVKMYNRAGGSVSNLEVAVHEIATYNSLGHVEGTAHMLDHRLDEAAGMACMVQK